MSRYTASKITRKPWFADNAKGYGAEWEQFKKNNPLKNKVCEVCGRKKNLQRHHIIPVKKEGKHVASNIQILCLDCHKDKHPHMKR